MLAILITFIAALILIHYSPTIGARPAWTAITVLIVLVVLACLRKI